jgi:hypothetical protein
MNRNAKIHYVLTNRVSMNFSNKFILEIILILYGGFDNEKITDS